METELFRVTLSVETIDRIIAISQETERTRAKVIELAIENLLEKIEEEEESISWESIVNKPLIPTKTSELLNDSGFVNSTEAMAFSPVKSVNNQIGDVIIKTSKEPIIVTSNSGIAHIDLDEGTQFILTLTENTIITLENGLGNKVLLVRQVNMNTYTVNFANNIINLLPTDKTIIPGYFHQFNLYKDSEVAILTSSCIKTKFQFNRDISLFNLLSYTATAQENYSYQDSSSQVKNINDGNWNSGVIKLGGGTNYQLKFTATFSTPVYINRIEIQAGQFNGDYNGFTTIEIYSSDYSMLLASIAEVNYTKKTFSLIGNPAFNQPRTIYGILLKGAYQPTNLSCKELAFYGHLT